MFSLVFWLFVLVLALSYFGISLQAIITSQVGQENFAYLYHLAMLAWHWIQINWLHPN